MHAFSNDQIEADVSAALAGYKLALIRTGYNGLWHKLLCWAGDNEARARALTLERAEKHFPCLIGQTQGHRLAFERIVRQICESEPGNDRLLKHLSRAFAA